MKDFDFEEERVKEEILKRGAKRVLMQLPEGLKSEAPRLARVIEKAGALPIVSADPCYGACDLAASEAEGLGVDLIVHYGHTRFVKHEPVPTIYVEARATVDVVGAVEKALSLMREWRSIGLATTIQHVQTLDNVREYLLRAGKTVAIGDAGRLSYPGQVIGCDYSNVKSIAKDVEAFIFVGGGRFHAIGVAMAASKPTIAVDPYEDLAFSVGEEVQRILKQRWTSIEQAQKGKVFAVLVGLKPGQGRMEGALKIKDRLEARGRSTILFAVREVAPDIMMDFPTVDAYVNTACPRISIDDSSRFRKPVLTPNESFVAIGDLSWEELCKRGLLES